MCEGVGGVRVREGCVRGWGESGCGRGEGVGEDWVKG